jgi:hypothetical protein
MVLQGPELVQKTRDLCEDFGLQELNYNLSLKSMNM